MPDPSVEIRKHYEAHDNEVSLVARVDRILESLKDAPLDASQIGGLDQFHVRGLAATAELAELAGIRPGMKILDAGSGLGGPSRFLAEIYQCDVIGVDLTPSFVAVARLLAERAGLAARLRYEVADLLALPFPDQEFDVVWTQHVVMNIADRARVYREFRRVLRPGGQLAFYDVIASDAKPELRFPVPWAESGETSFLLSKDETIAVLDQAGLATRIWKDVTAETLAWFGQPGAPSSQGLSLATVMGPRFAEMAKNLAENVRDGCVRIVMGICEMTRV